MDSTLDKGDIFFWRFTFIFFPAVKTYFNAINVMYDNLQKNVPVLAPWTPAVLCFCLAFWDCFHTRAKCAIWMIIRIAQFELCSVHTREVIAIFELQSVHMRDRICGLRILEREQMRGSYLVTLPIKHARSLHFLCFCTCAVRGTIKGTCIG